MVWNRVPRKHAVLQNRKCPPDAVQTTSGSCGLSVIGSRLSPLLHWSRISIPKSNPHTFIISGRSGSNAAVSTCWLAQCLFVWQRFKHNSSGVLLWTKSRLLCSQRPPGPAVCPGTRPENMEWTSRTRIRLWCILALLCCVGLPQKVRGAKWIS